MPSRAMGACDRSQCRLAVCDYARRSAIRRHERSTAKAEGKAHRTTPAYLVSIDRLEETGNTYMQNAQQAKLADLWEMSSMARVL